MPMMWNRLSADLEFVPMSIQLATFVRSLVRNANPQETELVINGDLVDFLPKNETFAIPHREK